VFATPYPPFGAAEVRQVQALPLALGAFLLLLAVGAVGHVLATAARRRRHELAVLRAVGMTRWQSRGVLVTQASVLAVVGLLFGVPLGVALGRTVWRVVADYTPLYYVSPVASWALLLLGPLALLVANLLAAWPGHQAARLRIGDVLRAE
jgi:ABC-type antimicrobial peptide transport system permease subunit